MWEYCCVCLFGLLRPRRREVCHEGNGFLFWLTEGKGRNMLRLVLDDAFLFESQNR